MADTKVVYTVEIDATKGKKSLDDFDKTAKQVEKSMEDLKKQSKETSTSLDEGSKTTDIANNSKSKLVGTIVALSTAYVALKKGVIDSTKLFMDYDDQMRKVAAITDASSEEMEKLDKAARKAGETTRFTATESASALEALASAGFTTEQAIAALPSTLNLAAAGQIDLGTSAEWASSVLRLWGKEVGDLTMITDQWAKAANVSNAEIDDMAAANMEAGGILKGFGQDMAESNAILSVFANNGNKGAEAGTNLRNIMLALYTPVAATKEMMKDMGVTAYDAAGNAKGLGQVMDELRIYLSTLDEEARNDVINKIFNRYDINAVNSLLNTSSEEVKSLTEQIQNSSGASKKFADTLEGGLGGKMRTILSKLEGVLLNIGKAVAEKINPVIDEMTKELDNILASGIEKDVANFVKILSDMALFLIKNKDTLILLAKVYIGVKAATIAYNAVMLTTATTTKVVSAATKLLSGDFSMLSNAFSKSAVGSTALGGKVSNLASTLTTGGGAAKLLSGAMAFLTNPVTIVLGITAIASALVLWQIQANKAKKENEGLSASQIFIKDRTKALNIELMNFNSTLNEINNNGVKNFKGGMEKLQLQLNKEKLGINVDREESINNINALFDGVNATYDEQLNETYGILSDYFDKSNTLSEEKEQEILSNSITYNEKRKTEMNALRERYLEIETGIKDGSLQITNELLEEKQRLQKEISNTVINELTKNQQESAYLTETFAMEQDNLQRDWINKYKETRLKADEDSLTQIKTTAGNTLATLQNSYNQGLIDLDTYNQLKNEALNTATTQELDTYKQTTSDVVRIVTGANNEQITEFDRLASEHFDALIDLAKQYGMDSKEYKDYSDKKKKEIESLTGITFDKYFQLKEDLVKLGPEYSTAFEAIGEDIVSGTAKGIENNKQTAWNAMTNMANTMKNAMTESFKIKSPSRVMADIAQWIPKGVAMGIDDNIASATAAMDRLSNDMIMQIPEPNIRNNTRSIGAINMNVTSNSANAIDVANEVMGSVYNGIDEYLGRLI